MRTKGEQIDGKNKKHEAHVIAALGFRYRDRQIPDHRADQPQAGRIKENRDAEKQKDQARAANRLIGLCKTNTHQQ